MYSNVRIKNREIEPGIVVLEMTGRILMGPDCQLIEQEVEQLLRQNQTRVIFDLSGVASIDSVGVGKIVSCFSQVKKSGGSLRLAGVKGMLEGVFKLVQVHKVIAIYPTASDAAESFTLEGQR
ncbi:MAG: STAS domain-containing protein [Candidatus Acidiferrales bacterium]